MVADLRHLYEHTPARPLLLDPELARMVSDLTREVEQFDSLLNSHRQLLLRRTIDAQGTGFQWGRIRAEVGRITTKVYAVFDEIALPITDS
jgi:hypothetical protein